MLFPPRTAQNPRVAPGRPPSSFPWTRLDVPTAAAPRPRTLGLRLIRLLQSPGKRNKQKRFLLYQMFTEGCNVLGFPRCRIRSSKRNFLETVKLLKPPPRYQTWLGPKRCLVWIAPGFFFFKLSGCKVSH